jgi:hypothetical protein|tara:strand:+ start:946 stop:1377 length:432 start_codon:yes stop_codon:yes gene_type:complete
VAYVQIPFRFVCSQAQPHQGPTRKVETIITKLLWVFASGLQEKILCQQLSTSLFCSCLGNEGIRCNCITPGRLRTLFVDDFLEKNYLDNRDEIFEKLLKTQPIGRRGKARKIAGLVAYLSSDQAAFVTGSNFPIDGGFVTLNN